MGTNRIVVLTALPLEAAEVRAHLPERTRHDLPAGTIVEEAELPDTGYTVCLVCTGPGNGQAAVVAERVINWADPAAVFFVGVAGRLKDDVGLGDVVAATRVMDYQGGKDTTAGFNARPEAWAGAHRLLQVAQYVEATASWLRFLPNSTAPNVHFKPVASGDRVKDTNDSPLAALLHTTYNDAAAIEMEAAGVARAAQHTGVELLVIRGISDRSDGTKESSDGQNWQRMAARNAAALALGVIAALPARDATGGSAPAHMAASPGLTKAPDWSMVDPAPAVSWRTDLHRPYGTEPATLEVHLIPAGATARLQVTQLQSLWGEMVQLGRVRGLFGQAEAIEGQPSANGTIAFARSRRGGETTGLALQRTGQRSAWEALPATNGGVPAAIFDPAHIAARLAALLDLLLAVPIPLTGQIVPVAGIAPAMLITRGTAGVPHHGAITIRMNDHPVRTEASEAVSADSLRDAVAPVAQELAARLDLAFDAPHR